MSDLEKRLMKEVVVWAPTREQRLRRFNFVAVMFATMIAGTVMSGLIFSIIGLAVWLSK